MYEVRTPTGIRINCVDPGKVSLRNKHTHSGQRRTRVFLPVTNRTAPSLTLEDPKVQALIVALTKAQINSGQKVNGIASAHGAVATATAISYGAAIIAVSWPIHIKL